MYAARPSRITLVRRHARRHGWLQLPPRATPDDGVKPVRYLPFYERLTGPLRFRACAVLELGVWQGDSLVMWRDGLPRATVVGVDIDPPPLDLGPRVHVLRADQTDAAALKHACESLAPGGFDLIVDDAAHVGVFAARSLQALFSDHLKRGGHYVIEDWGTGYMPRWTDGALPDPPVRTDALDEHRPAVSADTPRPVRLASHDVGMVGLVKRLVDHVGCRETLQRHGYPQAQNQQPLPVESIELRDGLAVLRKRA